MRLRWLLDCHYERSSHKKPKNDSRSFWSVPVLQNGKREAQRNNRKLRRWQLECRQWQVPIDFGPHKPIVRIEPRQCDNFSCFGCHIKPTTPDVSQWTSLITRSCLKRYCWILFSLVSAEQERFWPGLFTVAPIWRAYLTSLPKWLKKHSETTHTMYELINPVCKRNFWQESAIQTSS